MQAFLDRLGAVMTNRGRILGYLNTRTKGAEPIVFDAKRIEEFFIFANTWNTQSISSVKLTWADDIIETKTVSKERQVPYQVPVQVEKQRTVMKTVKVPFWQAKPAAETPSTAPVPQPPSPPM